MRRFALILCSLAVAFWVTPSASAESSDDYLNLVVSGLKDANVYVVPGTPGTTSDTASVLESKLTVGDGIELAMLPADAAKVISDPQDFVQQLSVKLGNDDVIGLTIGDSAYGYSAVLPKTVASDLMGRALSVSTTPDETLYTFSRNVHSWEADHPHEVAVPAAPGGGGFPWLIALLIAAALVAAGGVLVRRLLTSDSPSETVRLKKSPESVKQYLEQLLDLRKQVADYELQETLLKCCGDVEAYFDRYTSDRDGDAVKFGRNLERMVDVIKKYVDVQNNERYYNSPSDELRKGKKSASDFAAYVLKSCKSGSTSLLASYNVNIDILDAQQYR